MAISRASSPCRLVKEIKPLAAYREPVALPLQLFPDLDPSGVRKGWNIFFTALMIPLAIVWSSRSSGSWIG